MKSLSMNYGIEIFESGTLFYQHLGFQFNSHVIMMVRQNECVMYRGVE